MQNQRPKPQTGIQNVSAAKIITTDEKNGGAQYNGERRRRLDRRISKSKFSKERRRNDRRSRHLHTSNRIKTFIRNSEDPSALGGNHFQGKIINEEA